ncbi:MAG: alpha-amylase family glycosyl hydrolase, partial [Candidatus Binatia bacterium]
MREWWRSAVFYEIYVRSFQDSDGDGVGDLNGIAQRLDYLNDGTPRSLGVDALWLTPINPSPMHDFGYDVSDYTAVDPLFGSLGDVDRLIAEAHRRGMRIILDLVPNHTSHEHAWFKDSRAGRGATKRDWYIWRDPAPGGGPPNNWVGSFGGPAWTLDPATGQYYLHSFLAEQPDLNYRNSAVARAIE